MKVHFTASITGKKLYSRNYEKIVGEIKRLGYKITEEILNKDRKDIENLTNAQLNINFRHILDLVKNADLLVAETSYSSASVSFEVMTALRMSKQVLLLHIPTNHASLVEAARDRNMTVCEYNLENLEIKLPEALKEIEKKVNVRFNFFISKGLVGKLEHMALDERLNKSEYIRRLIEKDMKKNKRYDK